MSTSISHSKGNLPWNVSMHYIPNGAWPEGKRALTTALLLVPLCALLTDCSLPLSTSVDGTTRRFVLGYASENEHNYLTRRVIPGIDVRIDDASSGVSIGWSDLTVVSPRLSDENQQEPPVAPCSHYAPPFAVSWCSSDGTRYAVGLVVLTAQLARSARAPLFLAHTYAGLTVGFGSLLQGMEVGFGNVAVTTVPAGASGLYMLRYLSGKPSETCFERRKEGLQ